MPIEVPAGWRIAKLSEAADITAGINKPKSAMGSGRLYVTVQDLYTGTSIPVGGLGRIEVTDEEARTRSLQLGDIVFGKSSVKRSGIGYPSQFLGSSEPVIFSGFTYRARAKKAVADSAFLFQALRWQQTRDWLVAHSQASALTNLNKGIADAIPVPLPPLAEQKKIAAILSSVDEAIHATQAVIEQTRRVKEGLLQDLLTRGIGHTRFKQTKIGEIPQSWEVATLAEIARVIDCKHRTPVYSSDGFPVVRPGNVAEGPLILDGCLNVSEEEYLDLIERHRPQVGDIVYSRNQNYGVSAYVDDDRPFAIGQDVCILQPFRLRTRFFHFALSSDVVWSQIRRIMAGSTFKRINLGDIRKFKVPVPPSSEQKAIETVISSADASIAAEHSEVTGLQQVKAGLLQDLLTGRVRVSA